MRLVTSFAYIIKIHLQPQYISKIIGALLMNGGDF